MGGDGADTFELTCSATKKLSATIEDLDPANDKIIVNFDGDTAPQFTGSVNGNDVVLRDAGGNFNVTLKSVRDNDYLNSDVSDEAWEVLSLTNDEREAQNLSALTASDGLTNAAQIRANKITKQGNLGVLENHTRPDGSQWDTVFDGKYNFPGENLDGGGSGSGRGGNDSGGTSGGTSAKEGMTSDFSGSGRSAVGSRGRSSSTSTDTSSGGTVSGITTRRGGGTDVFIGGRT